MVIGNLAIYICGLLWLARFVPVESLLRVGLLPFLLGDAFKIGLSMLLLPSAWHLINGRIPKKFDK
jgi:biotin transport system substrate-specific component